MEKWRDFLRVEWWKDCGVETKNLWRNPWKIRQMPAAVSTACGNAFAQPSTGDSTAAEDASGKSLAAAKFFLHMGFPQLVENGVENRKFSVERRWKARIFKEIPRFHRKRQTEKSGREKESVAESFPYQAAPPCETREGRLDFCNVPVGHCKRIPSGTENSLQSSVGTRRAVSADLRQGTFRWKRSTGTFPRSQCCKRDTGRSGLVRSALEKLSLFSPTFSVRQKHGAESFAVCGRRLRGHVPSKNTSPTALSWISLFGHTDAVCFVPAR